MGDGWVKLWRKSIDTGLIKNHNVWIFWTYCLMKANHKKDYKQVVGFQEIILQPGQFIFGLNVASEETLLSIQNIRTCLAFLKKYKNLTIKSTNKFSVISVVNWDAYQSKDIEANKQTNTRVTSSQQAGNNKQEQKNKRTKEKNNHKETCGELILKINEVGGKNFRVIKSNFDFIIPRLKEGFTKDDCLAVINNKKVDPNFNMQYFKPETLFRKSKFEGYLNEDPKNYKKFSNKKENNDNFSEVIYEGTKPEDIKW